MPTPRLTLTHLAQQAAAQIGFTVRRWWRDATDAAVLQVEVERRLVGAPPAIVVLRVPLPTSVPAPRLSRKAPPPSRRARPRARATQAAKGKRGRTH